MPPKKKRPLVWLPLVYRPLIGPEGEYREYYLPLSKEEIERDLEHLGSLLQAAAHGKQQRRAAAAAGRLAVQHATGGGDSEDLSPSSAGMGDDGENESGNPTEAAWAAAHKAAGQQQHAVQQVAAA